MKLPLKTCPKTSQDVSDSDQEPDKYDAFLLVSFGGPDRPEDVRPFLENIFRNKPGPPDRIDKAVARYEAIGGASPINLQNQELLRAIVDELRTHGHDLPVYWGNRYWHPMLGETMQHMAEDGIQHALAFIISAFGSYPSCRQYLEDIQTARSAVGDTAPKDTASKDTTSKDTAPKDTASKDTASKDTASKDTIPKDTAPKDTAPEVDKIRLFFNHPRFIKAVTDRVTDAIGNLPEERRDSARLLFTAHSIPQRMADNSPYVEQIRESSRLVAEQLKRTEWDLAFQSGPQKPRTPWLAPTIEEKIAELHKTEQADTLVIVPIGFLSDHMEVIYDLDVKAAQLCDELGIIHTRAATVGCHPEFITMIRELVEERQGTASQTDSLPALGDLGPAPHVCHADCCRGNC